MAVQWTPVPEAQGYSVSWTGAADDVPDEVADLPGDAGLAQSPTLDPGSWWFHMRTQGPGGDWTATVHVGPFVIVPAGIPPEIRKLQISPIAISEIGASGSCGGQPTAAQITATGVTDPDGSVAGVVLTWEIDAARTGNVPMDLNGKNANTSLSFPFDTIEPAESPATVTITVAVTDDDGLTTTATDSLTLLDCP